MHVDAQDKKRTDYFSKAETKINRYTMNNKMFQ